MDDQTGFDALGYLQAVYRGKIVAETQRMRAAMAALPFEKPKLQVTASIDGRYAAQLEAAMKVRGLSPVIDCTPKAISAKSP